MSIRFQNRPPGMPGTEGTFFVASPIGADGSRVNCGDC
jgi:hypothetical protein